MNKTKLTREDWLAAGFRAIAKGGPGAMRITTLASELKATKGSFYWHFRDLGAFQDALLALWQEKVVTEIVAQITAEPDPIRRLDQLVEAAATPAPDEFGGAQIETAMRAWALSDPAVAERLATIDAERRRFVTGLLNATGLDDPALSDLICAAYIGLDDLNARSAAPIAPALSRLIQLIKMAAGHG